MVYLEYNVYLTPNQKHKLTTCFRKKEECTLKIQPKVGTNKFLLTANQIQRLRNARAQKKSCTIDLTWDQIQQSGGFLSFLLPLAAAAAPFVGRTLAGLALSSGTKALYDKMKGKGLKRPKAQTVKGKRRPKRETLKGKGYILPWMVTK